VASSLVSFNGLSIETLLICRTQFESEVAEELSIISVLFSISENSGFSFIAVVQISILTFSRWTKHRRTLSGFALAIDNAGLFHAS